MTGLNIVAASLAPIAVAVDFGDALGSWEKFGMVGVLMLGIYLLYRDSARRDDKRQARLEALLEKANTTIGQNSQILGHVANAIHRCEAIGGGKKGEKQ